MNRRIFFVIVQLFCVFILNAQENTTSKVAEILNGRIAGITSMQTNGELGKNISNFWYRGISSFGANKNALVLIDGVEGDINSLDPANIKSIAVLKDASATAVYGVRGANGVVLITTKSGSKELIEEPETIENTNAISSIDTEKASNLIISEPVLTELQLRIIKMSSFQNQDVDEPKEEPKKFFINCDCLETSRTNPLILVDGVESTSDDLGRLSPDDIESFSVFKDASATALFGARGVNGVISITTKSENKNVIEKPKTIETEKPLEPYVLSSQLENKDATETDDTDVSEAKNPFPELKIYPNPFSGTLYIAGAEGCTLQVTTETGVVVHSQKLIHPTETIPLEHLRTGVYFFNVNNGKQSKMVKGVKN